MDNNELPNSYISDMEYSVPHDQGDKQSCVAHAIATVFELQLGPKIGKKIFIDVDELWERMLKAGVATENGTTIPKAINYIRSTGFMFVDSDGEQYMYDGEHGVYIKLKDIYD